MKSVTANICIMLSPQSTFLLDMFRDTGSLEEIKTKKSNANILRMLQNKTSNKNAKAILSQALMLAYDLQRRSKHNLFDDASLNLGSRQASINEYRLLAFFTAAHKNDIIIFMELCEILEISFTDTLYEQVRNFLRLLEFSGLKLDNISMNPKMPEYEAANIFHLPQHLFSSMSSQA